jgi:hypothetical protein
MITVINTKNNNLYFQNENNKCIIDISVIEMLYENGLSFYDITYLCNEINKSHPFFNKESLMEFADGEIIAKNFFSEAIINFLMSNEDLVFKSLRVNHLNTNELDQYHSENERTNDATFTNPFSESINCNMRISSKIVTINNMMKVYYLEFDADELNNANPFITINEKKKIKLVIFKNEITDRLVDLLMMENDELSNYSGNVDPICYKSSLIQVINVLNKANPQNYKGELMKAITFLWD